MSNHYAVLGVYRTARREEIDAAWRKMSLTAHPDRGGSAESFHALVEARDVLLDPVRRAEYDRQRQAGRTEPLETSLSLDVVEAWGIGRGRPVVRQLVVRRHRPCTLCGGSGSTDPLAGRERCHCFGTPGCRLCGGSGEVVADSRRCPRCLGRRVQAEEASVPVRLAGLPSVGLDEWVLLLEGEGNEDPGLQQGDLVVHVLVALADQGRQLRRVLGNCVLAGVEFGLADCLLGGSVSVRQLGIRVAIPAGALPVQPTDILAVQGEGLLAGGSNLYIQPIVVLPRLEADNPDHRALAGAVRGLRPEPAEPAEPAPDVRLVTGRQPAGPLLRTFQHFDQQTYT